MNSVQIFTVTVDGVSLALLALATKRLVDTNKILKETEDINADTERIQKETEELRNSMKR